MIKHAVLVLSLLMALTAHARDYKKTEDILNIILSEKETSGQKTEAPQQQPGPAPKPTKGTEGSKPSAEDPAQVLLKNGIRLYSSGLHDQALASFDEVVQKHGDSPLRDQARIWMGKIQIRQHQYDDALKTFNAVSADSGEYPAALFHGAEAESSRGNTLRAAELYQSVAARFPEHDLADNALYRAGTIYLEAERGNQALESTIRLIRYYRDRETIDDAYFLLGKIFERDRTLKDLETTRKIYRLFLKKASAGEPHFSNSPLRERVRSDLRFIEKSFFMMEE
jgi:TolA-binding protein